MQVVGLEPTRGCPRKILSLVRLPFRHTCLPKKHFLLLFIKLLSQHNVYYHMLL